MTVSNKRRWPPWAAKSTNAGRPARLVRFVFWPLCAMQLAGPSRCDHRLRRLRRRRLPAANAGLTLGEVIREAAADADFIAAAQTTLDRATPEGGIWKLLAAAKLANLLAVSKLIDAKIADAREDLNPLLAQIAVVDGAADDLLVQGKNLI